jgi:acyl-CoA thioesterase FadM
VTSDISGHVYAAVNVNTFENVDQAWLSRAAVNFEKEDAESRLARRRINWIADVRIGEAVPLTSS